MTSIDVFLSQFRLQSLNCRNICIQNLFNHLFLFIFLSGLKAYLKQTIKIDFNFINNYYNMATMRPSMRKNPSINSSNSVEKVEQTVIMTTGAKIHRANILARIVHSISLYQMEWAYLRIKIWGGIRKKCYNKMGLAINRIFRRNFYQRKFNAFQKIKQQLIEAQSHQIRHSQKIIDSMAKASKSIIFSVLKSKRRQIISQALQKIKFHAIQTNFKKRSDQRKAFRLMLQFLTRDKRYAFDRMCTSRVNVQRKHKLRNFTSVVHTHRKQNLSWGVWKLRRNLIDKRRQQVQSDIKMFELKINNSSDPQVKAIKQRKDKLQEHLNKIQRQKDSMQQQFNSQYNQVQNQRKQLQNKISALQENKQTLQQEIQQVYKQVNSAYSLDEIYQCVYNNFLLYLNENKEQVYNKQQVLHSLSYPLIPIDVPIDTIKQQNKVMEELLNEYIVMFGPKKLQGPVQLPYEYLVKENQVMYKMLLTLLPLVEGDRDDLRVIRDSLFKLNAKVGELWGK